MNNSLTWDDEKNVLNRSECFSPSAIESDQDKHQALGVEGRPAEEERKHNDNYNIKSSYNDFQIEDYLTQHLDDSSFPLEVGPASYSSNINNKIMKKM